LAYLDEADPKRTRLSFGEEEWTGQRIAALDAVERRDEAQRLRYAEFEKSLDAHHLKTYLKNLPEFDDVEAEQAALDYALGYSKINSALHFLINWPAHEHASKIVLSRAKELDGDLYELMTPAADILEEKYPLAAVIIRRAMVDFTLSIGRASRYGHAVTHILSNENLDGWISDYDGFETHEEFMSRIKADHPRKTSFWSKFPE